MSRRPIIIATASVVLAVAAVVIATRVYFARLQAAREATANREVEAVKSSALQAIMKIAQVDPRRISPRQAKKFTDLVHGSPNEKVVVEVVANDADAATFGEQIRDLLQQAEFPVEYRTRPPEATPEKTPRGLLFYVRGEPATPPHALAIADGFRQASIPMTLGLAPDLDPNALLIVVGKEEPK